MYMPTKRGFVVGVALWCTVIGAGCGFDTGRMHIDPNTGETIVEKAGKLVPPKPGEAGFVGPVAPAPSESFSDGKREAKADFNKTVSWATGVALWIFIPLAILVALASFVVPWIPTKAAIYCAVSACAVVGIRYALLVFGTIAVDWAVYISAASAVVVALVVGLPMVIAWVKRKAWTRGVNLAREGDHIEGATAILASVDPKIDAIRKSVEQWLIDAKTTTEDGATARAFAKEQLAKLGVKI